eukprot:scaffold12086_cov49-Attheya_sp.AAC.2
MASNLELVDRSDQLENAAAKGRYMTGDLFLSVEEEEDDAHNGNSTNKRSIRTTTSNEYIGLELDAELERRSKRRRKMTALILCLSLLAFAATVGYSRRGGNHPAPSPTSKGSSSSNGNASPTASQPKTSTSSTTTTSPTVRANDEAKETTTLWPTLAPLPAFPMCAPPRVALSKRQAGLRVFHMSNIRIVPEAPTVDDYDESWEYSFSAMDMNKDASLLAAGLADFSADTEYSVGLVRAFGFDCDTQTWKQVGQDLLGTNEGEQFGSCISSSGDGQIMAVSATQDSYDDGIGFVEVYYLNNGNRWELLGTRIERLNDSGIYSRLGSAIDLSDKGETLAILAKMDDSSYVIRVFEYDYNVKDWVRKGKNLKVQVDYADGYDYDPQLSLSEDGDELAMVNPKFGLVTYHFDFKTDAWAQQGAVKSAGWDDNENAWIESHDFDDAGDLVAFSGFIEDNIEDADTGDNMVNIVNVVKLIDFHNTDTLHGIGNGTEVFVKEFPINDVNIAVAVSDDGQCAAIVASKMDIDDDNYWVGDIQYIGAMTIVTKTVNEDTTDTWTVLGEGTKADGIGVPGNFVTLSGDGRVAAVGSDKVVALYAIDIDGTLQKETDTNTDANITDTNSENTGVVSICAPFPNVTLSGYVGDIDQIPKRQDERTLALAMSVDGSIVAVGIDTYDGEDRGMVRVFGWDCASQLYARLGQDLFGGDEFDGFGQSVDLSSDGKTLVIGANQPPPGKSGYVEVYSLVMTDVVNGTSPSPPTWEIVGSRMDKMENLVEDVGRQVKISDDGSIVMFSGSIVEESDYGWSDTASYIRVMELVNGEWQSKGNELVGSIEYDDNGAEVHISQSGDGLTLGVTGSYSSFLAKLYTFDPAQQNWTEIIVPPLKSITPDADVNVDLDDDYEDEEEYDEDYDDKEEEGDDDDDDDEDYNEEDYEEEGEDYEWDYEYVSYFSGSDLAISTNGNMVAIAGIQWNFEGYTSLARTLTRNETTGKFSLSTEFVEYKDEWSPSSLGMSADGRYVALGINTHSTNTVNQGAMFIVGPPKSSSSLVGDTNSSSSTPSQWSSLDELDGREEGDMLGSRVDITRDGTLAAASSRNGYISFYKIVANSK